MEAMTDRNDKERQALDRLADALADDILSLSDQEVLVEFIADNGDPAKNATDMRALFEKTVIATNKQRLKAAQAGVTASRHLSALTPATDVAGARARLRRLLAAAANDPTQKLTIAARKEDELSDADVLGMLEDYDELGVLPPEDESDDGR